MWIANSQKNVTNIPREVNIFFDILNIKQYCKKSEKCYKILEQIVSKIILMKKIIKVNLNFVIVL